MSDTMGADGTEAQQGPQWRQLEQKVTAAEARVTALEGQLDVYRGNAIQQAARLAGFQPNAEGKFEGPAALLLGEFERTIGDAVPTVDAFSALATQYGVAPPTAPMAAAGEPGTPSGVPSIAEQLAAMQVPGAGITQVGTAPGGPATVEDTKAALLAAGDVGGFLDVELANYRPVTTG